MKILSAEQTRKADQFTIENEPISSLDLMEHAAKGLFEVFINRFDKTRSASIFCGKGNNGGDGLALARMLEEAGYSCSIFLIGFSAEELSESSGDFQKNFEHLPKNVEVSAVKEITDFPDVEKTSVLVDAILGSGLSRPLEGLVLKTVEKLNSLDNQKVAVDIPTGLFADDNSENRLEKVLQADLTLTFQAPKFSFFHRESAPKVGRFEIIDIQLDKEFIASLNTKNFYISKKEVQNIYKERSTFSYKNNFGHALLLAGQEGSYGAAILSGLSAMRAGAGLLTVHTSKSGLSALQSAAPEAQVSLDVNAEKIIQLPDLYKFTAVAMGPGVGTKAETLNVLKSLLENVNTPLVLDADALNLLSQEIHLCKKLPENTILTPHIGEFKRLLGVEELEADYFEKLSTFSKEHKINIILKDSITTISDKNGHLFFMKEGTPTLASGGSGDVLTGIVLGFLSSGYSALEAAQLAVWLQGNAGRLAGEKHSEEAALARDVIDEIGSAFQILSRADSPIEDIPI